MVVGGEGVGGGGLWDAAGRVDKAIHKTPRY